MLPVGSLKDSPSGLDYVRVGMFFHYPSQAQDRENILAELNMGGFSLGSRHALLYK